MKLERISLDLLNDYKAAAGEAIDARLAVLNAADTPVPYFDFYNSVSSVYSSKIEGEEIDYDSFFKHKFMGLPYQPDYTKRADDLYRAYEYIAQHPLTLANVQQAHTLLSANILPASRQGLLRSNPMFIINQDDRIEYVAASPGQVRSALTELFADVETLLAAPLDTAETLYFAAYIHLDFVNIHPFQDGNGRTSRLLEKWFLRAKLGDAAAAIPLEKNYYRHRPDYYANLRRLGVEYDRLDYGRALPFLLMTVQGLG